MGEAGACDQSDVRGGDLRQARDLAGLAGSHLDDRRVERIVELKEHHGHANPVVQVALGGENAMASGAQRGRRELLGGRLAHGSGDGDDLAIPSIPVCPGEVAESVQRVVDLDCTHVRRK